MLLVAAAAPADAQVLKGDWVTAADKRIAQQRMAEVRVLVLDARGRPAPLVPVHLAMQRHAFAWGIRLNAHDFDRDDRQPFDADAKVWRCFSTVSLEALTDWPVLEPDAQAWNDQPVRRALHWARQRRLDANWGAMIWSDPGRVPGWVAALDDAALRTASDEFISRAVRTFGREIEQFDVLANIGNRAFVMDRMGMATVRHLYQVGGAQGATAKLALSIDDALSAEQAQAAIRQITAMREAFVPVERVSLRVRLPGTVVEAQLSRPLNWIAEAGLPIVIDGLEAGGSSEAAAMINLETALRVFFASPAVQGVTLQGVRADELADPSAALLDDQSEPTQAGKLLDSLVHGAWWTDVTQRSDELGNAQARVFAGLYQVSATLPDGSKAQAEVWLPAGRAERLIVIQPIPRQAD
ncbi:MAG: endo-1,4-beta-xylanase [Phycisphaeraceae bacterium]